MAVVVGGKVEVRVRVVGGVRVRVRADVVVGVVVGVKGVAKGVVKIGVVVKVVVTVVVGVVLNRYLALRHSKDSVISMQFLFGERNLVCVCVTHAGIISNACKNNKEATPC